MRYCLHRYRACRWYSHKRREAHAEDFRATASTSARQHPSPRCFFFQITRLFFAGHWRYSHPSKQTRMYRSKGNMTTRVRLLLQAQSITFTLSRDATMYFLVLKFFKPSSRFEKQHRWAFAPFMVGFSTCVMPTHVERTSTTSQPPDVGSTPLPVQLGNVNFP